MPKVSVIIPTHNRPEMLKRSIRSVLAQSYNDFELIIVDDGLKDRAKEVVNSFSDSRIRYIAHEHEKGGGAARNTGIKAAEGELLAFQDDDDEWLSDKLAIQVRALEKTSQEVGFCFSAVELIYDDHKERSKTFSGTRNFFEDVLSYFSGFLNVTLVIKHSVIDDIGMFDESLPSHQETDLVLRMAKKYRGLGIDEPLVMVHVEKDHERTGGSLKRRIAGREIILKKYAEDLKHNPKLLAEHYFWLGLFYRDDKNYRRAGELFKKAFHEDHNFRYLGHFISMVSNGAGYKILKHVRN